MSGQLPLRPDLKSSHTDRADALFRQGCNCAQAVLASAAEELGLDFETALRLSAPFGGGMGRLREVCGALTGLFMVAGLRHGYADPEDRDAKTAHYALIQQLGERFRAEFGSLLCRDLIELAETVPGPAPELRTDAFYSRRPCLAYVRYAASLGDELAAQAAAADPAPGSDNA